MIKYFTVLAFLLLFALTGKAQWQLSAPAADGYEKRISDYVDTLTVFDTHEHLMDPEKIKNAGFLDFSLLFLQYGYYDILSAGMPDTLFNKFFSASSTPLRKWEMMEPYWHNSFNTMNNRIILQATKDLYNIGKFDSSSVITLSERMEAEYSGDWFDYIIRKKCRIDHIVQDGDRIRKDKGYVRYAQRFNPWILVKTKNTIDSLALRQTDPIYTLDDFVKSMSYAFEKAANNNMCVVKINIAYDRTLSFENSGIEAAKKVFKTIVNGNEDTELSEKDAKPLQDYMLFQLISMADKHHIPVAFHTGLQSGEGNLISNSNPVLLSNIFSKFPNVNFVMFHGSYPFGGELSTLAKTYKNVYIDMNWTYAISSAYASRYLEEWLEAVPVSKIMAFGGDETMPELTYGSLLVAKKVVSDALIEKVRTGYFSEEEAKRAAKLLLHDNGMKFYNIN